MMALECDVKAVEFLLNHGANTELKDADGRTPLHVAAWQGYTDIVQVFIYLYIVSIYLFISKSISESR